MYYYKTDPLAPSPFDVALEKVLFMLWENTILVTQNTLPKTENPTLQLKKGEWRQFHPI